MAVTSSVPARPTHQMLASLPTRIAASLAFVFATLLPAQSKRPAVATSPAASLPSTPVTASPVLPLTPEQLPAHPASVTYADGLLTVSANNSSLNQILRDISLETQLKITGGVVDERVFGNYGPATTDHILNTLLDGTSSNMLLVHSHGSTPAELILTPRNGGPTPPNPNAIAQEQRDQQVEDQMQQESMRRREAAEKSQELNHPPAAENTDQKPANAPKTPQEIFDQLQKLRQQQQQQQQSTQK